MSNYNLFSSIFLAISKSWVLQLLLFVWAMLPLIIPNKREKLINNLAFFLRMPIIYDKESNEIPSGENSPIYPRRLFENSYEMLTENLCKPLERLTTLILSAIKFIANRLNKELILFGLILGILLYGDLIGVLNIISLVPNLLTHKLPPFLTDYTITISAGTILSIVVALFYMEDSKKNLTNNGLPTRRLLVRYILSIMLLIFGFLTVIGINLTKLPLFISSFTPEALKIINIISMVCLNLVVMFNASIAIALISREMWNGLTMFSFLILVPAYIIAVIFQYLAKIFTSLGPVIVDIIVRIIFIALNLVVFIIITPFDWGRRNNHL